MEGVGYGSPGARFALGRELGRGGMGVVYEAFDREWNVRVAVKTLRALGPEALLRLKNEFRAIAGIRHPNLVRLGELFVEGGQWLFTMELVDGVDFVRWARSDGRLDEAKLRDGLRQLADALHALHRTGRVHRDVKPSNVLVTKEGRVVLLDFGLITRVAADDAMTDGLVVGTPEYSAPEQSKGQPVTPAADWYSLGVLAHQALTGELPRAGSPALANAPADLAHLCARLLERDADRRIDWPELASALELDADVRDEVSLPFVGRDAELAALERALVDARRSGPLTVFLCGESGIGKSTLSRHFAERVLERTPDALILDGRASDRELVPFNGFDGVIDALLHHLDELPPDQLRQLLPAGSDALSAMFPVLSRVIAPTPSELADEPAPSRRKRGFTALRDLMAAIARRRTLVLTIDDFHWADDDALALRRALMAGPHVPGWLLVATVRTDGNSRTLLRRAVLSSEEHPGEVRQLELSPLDESAAATLVREIAGPISSVDVRGAHGHPLFLTEIARAGGGADDLRATIRSRMSALSPTATALIEVLSVAGVTLRPPLAASAAALDAEAYARAVDETRGMRLVRIVGAGLRAGIEPYHDEIRQAVLDGLSPERKRQLHRSLAEGIERAGSGAEPRTLFAHWLGAGDRLRAARAAEQAASEADRQLAFERAADYYARALELDENGGRRGVLLGRKARALANAGRKREAVAAYRAAAAVETGKARLDHLRGAAEVLIGNGDVDEGIDLLRHVLDAVGMRWPRGAAGVVLSVLAGRARIQLRGLRWTERPEASLPRSELARIDSAWSAAMALSLVDRGRGADFQERGLRLALDAGEPYRVARAIILEAAYSCAGGSRTRTRTRALLTTGRRAAERCAHPHALALIAAVEGIAHAMEGDFRVGAREIEAAEPLLRAHANRWDLLSAEYLLLMALSLTGELREVERRVNELEREALDSDDLSLLVNVHTGYPPLVRLVHDDTAGARRSIDQVMQRWSQRGFHRQHWSALLTRLHCDLYDGDGERAYRTLERAWWPLVGSLLMRSQPVRIAALDLRARAALATGRLRRARQDTERLEREGVAWASGLAALIRACLEPSSAAFERAAQVLDGAGLRLHAAVARRRAGLDDPWWNAQRVANPDGFIRCFAPGGGL